MIAKNAVCPDPVQRNIPSVSKSIKITASNETIDVESLSELLQPSVDEEMTPTQRSFYLAQENRKTMSVQAGDNEIVMRFNFSLWYAPI